MCGIVGIRRFDGAPVDVTVLRRMAAQLAHRGPDDEGYLVRGSVGFGHRRLSIIDPGHSAQPMSSNDGTLHVCFNGEILNYRKLRHETPYRYRTQGDTEVLLSTFDRLGPAHAERLVGQYAYALFSERDDNLWLFRDRVGILPLYYYWDDSQFLFASEIKGLLAALPLPEVDLASVADYLSRRSVPAPWTLFKGIAKLPPGSALRIGRDAPVAEPSRYCSIPEVTPQARRDPETAVSEFASVLRGSVARNLVADVPVGAYLSGGLDSSLIVSVMRDLRPEQEIRTFSATFGDPRVDETEYAKRVSELCGTRHHVAQVRADDFEECWPLLTWHRDGPISEASDIAVYHLALLASDHVKVVLSGEGSDELFAGYPKHGYARATRLASLLPYGLRGPLLGAIEKRMPPSLARARVAVRALSGRSRAERLEGWFAPFTPRERRLLLGSVPEHRRYPDLGSHGDALRQMLVADIQGWLTDNLLERGDRMTMAASVELRPPFLDREVVDWALALPSSFKLRDGRSKWVVRELARRHLPEEIVQRPKMGFRVPLDAWFRGRLADFVREALLSDDSFVGSILDRRMIVELVRRHAESIADEELRLWTLLSLEVWHRVFFRGPAPAAPAQAPAQLAGSAR